MRDFNIKPRLKKIKGVSQKNQNKNFFKKRITKYFGGSDPMNELQGTKYKQKHRLDTVLMLKTIFLLSFCLDLSSLISLRNQSYFGYHLDTALFNLLTLTERGHKFCKKSIFTCWSFELFFL